MTPSNSTSTDPSITEPTTMKMARVPEANGQFELVEVEIPEPGPGQVRVKVHACGVCHSDSLTVFGAMGNDFPRAPGHEVAGSVHAVGDGVEAWQIGDRVGVGWFGGCDFTCEFCRRGDFISCANGQIAGIAYDGGYAEYMVAPAEALARVPDDLSEAVATMPLARTSKAHVPRASPGPLSSSSPRLDGSAGA